MKLLNFPLVRFAKQSSNKTENSWTVYMYLLGNIDVIVQIKLETRVVPPTYAMVCFTDRVLVDHFIKWSVELIVN